MSQVRATTMTEGPLPVGRMLTRRASRSVATSRQTPSSLPEHPSTAAVDQRRQQASPDPAAFYTAASTTSTDDTAESNRSSSPDVTARVTRSQSIESATHHRHGSPEPSPPRASNTRKRPRRSASAAVAEEASAVPSKKRVKSNAKARDDRETRNSTQRMTKETREARRAQRQAEAKEKLAELDRLEESLKDGQHPEYLQLLDEIEQKRARRVGVTQARYRFAMANQTSMMEEARKSANDHFQLQKQGLRRRMIQHVQQQINNLEQEYYSHNATNTLDDQHAAEWIPHHRPSRLVVPLSEQEVDHDFELMRSAVAQSHPPSPARSSHHPPPVAATSHAVASPPSPQHPFDTITRSHRPHAALSRPHELPALPPPSRHISTVPGTSGRPPSSSPTLDVLASLADRQPQPYHHCIAPPETAASANQLVK